MSLSGRAVTVGIDTQDAMTCGTVMDESLIVAVFVRNDADPLLELSQEQFDALFAKRAELGRALSASESEEVIRCGQ